GSSSGSRTTRPRGSWRLRELPWCRAVVRSRTTSGWASERPLANSARSARRRTQIGQVSPQFRSFELGTSDAASRIMLDSETAEGLIKPHMPVVSSNNDQFAVVDHLEGRDFIKLAKDASGQHHYIPLSWVASVDDKVHVDRPGDQAMREWKT